MKHLTVFLGNGRVEDEKERDQRRWETILWYWGLGEYPVRQHLAIPIWQARLPIQQEITQIQGLPFRIRPVVPLISHIHSHAPYHLHLHPPSFSLVHNSTIIAEHKVKSYLSISPCHDHVLTPSTSIHTVEAYTKYKHTPSTSIHQVQTYTKYKHTPSTSIHQVQHIWRTNASIQDDLSSLPSHNYKFTRVCSFSFRHASLQDQPPPFSSPWKLKGTVTSSHSHSCQWTT